MMVQLRMPAACILAAATSGCMGSAMPDVAALTTPTEAAFATLAAWRPWSAPPEPVVVTVAPVEVVPLAPLPQASPVVTPAVMVAPIERPKARPRRAQPAPTIVPAASMSAAPVTTPAAVNCTTARTPTGRVRMECVPLD